MRAALTFAAMLSGMAMGAPDHDPLRDYQDACTSSRQVTHFSEQVACTKALIHKSADAKSDGPTRLYLLTADKLLDDVRNKRMTVAAARVELELALLDAEQRHKATAADAERDQQRSQEESARQAIVLLARANHAQAVSDCVDRVEQRYLLLIAQGDSTQLAQVFTQLHGTTSPEQSCEANSNYYDTLPKPPVTTRCQGDHYLGSIDMKCKTN